MNQNRLNFNTFTFNNPKVLDLREKIFNKSVLIKILDSLEELNNTYY